MRNGIPQCSLRKMCKSYICFYSRKLVKLWLNCSKGRFTHSMPRPCRSPAMPCRKGFRICLSRLIYTVRPCLIHTCHAAPMPCMPFFSRLWHSTAVERRLVGYLPAFGFFLLPCGVPRRLLSEAYQSSSQRSILNICKEW